MHKSIVALLLFATLPLVAQQTAPSKQTQRQQQHAAAPAAVSAEDAQALREDLARMRALVQQMQTNLAYVTSIQGPLKHQFELEIEMWQLEIASMERRLGQQQ